jgi:hypothetical protein
MAGELIPIKIVPLWVKVVAILGLLIVLIGGFVYVGYKLSSLREENKALRAQQDALLNRIGAEEAKNARQDKIFAERDAQQSEVRSKVTDVTVRIKQEKANDPVARNVLDARIPDGVRRAFRQAPATGSAAECKGADCAH